MSLSRYLSWGVGMPALLAVACTTSAQDAAAELSATPAPTEAASSGPAQAPAAATIGTEAAVTAQNSDTAAALATIPVAIKEPKAAPAKDAKRQGLGLEEIIVTAQKREESINTVPIAITAYSGEDLATLGIKDTRDLRALVPGFSAADSGYNTPIYTLRGIGFNDSTYTATSTVGLYVDEVNMPYSIMSKGANLDLERVEVLKGPQGTLYGRNTTGGLINYIAKKPTNTFEAGVTATYSRFQTADVEAFISGPLTDTLKARLAVHDIHASEGWQISQTRPNDRLGKVDKQSLRAALEWRPQDDLSFRFVVDGWIDKSDAQAPQVVGIKPQQPIVPNTPAFVQALLTQLPPGAQSLPGVQSLIAGNAVLAPQVANHPIVPLDGADPQTADWAPGLPWQLNDNYVSTALRSDWNIDETHKFTGIASYLKVASDGSNILQSGLDTVNSDQRIVASIDTEALELRLARNADDNYSWVVGANASHDTGKELHNLYLTTVSVLFPDPVTGHTVSDKVNTFGNQDADQLAAFVNGDWAFAQDFKLSGGARLTREKRSFEGCSFVEPSAMGPAGLPGLLPEVFTALSLAHGGHGVVANGAGHQKSGDLIGDCFTQDSHGNPGLFIDQFTVNNVAGRIALDWTPIDHYLFYSSISRGFKSGGYPVLNSTTQDQYSPTKQEQLLSYELGAKVTLIEGKLHFNTAGFFYDYKNKQLLTRFLDPVFGPLPILRNAPKSQVIGGELDLQATPVEGLFLSAAGAYIKTEILEFTSTTIDGVENTDFSGKPFNFSPRLTYTLIGDYTLPWAMFDLFKLGVAADYSYTGRTNSTLEQDPRYEHLASGVYGARIRAASLSGQWTLTAFGRNLTNELTTISNFNVGDGIARFVGPPRTYGMTLNYNFD